MCKWGCTAQLPLFLSVKKKLFELQFVILYTQRLGLRKNSSTKKKHVYSPEVSLYTILREEELAPSCHSPLSEYSFSFLHVCYDSTVSYLPLFFFLTHTAPPIIHPPLPATVCSHISHCLVSWRMLVCRTNLKLISSSAGELNSIKLNSSLSPVLAQCPKSALCDTRWEYQRGDASVRTYPCPSHKSFTHHRTAKPIYIGLCRMEADSENYQLKG